MLKINKFVNTLFYVRFKNIKIEKWIIFSLFVIIKNIKNNYYNETVDYVKNIKNKITRKKVSEILNNFTDDIISKKNERFIAKIYIR